MMKLNKFDENFEMFIKILEEKETVALTISDDLDVSEALPKLPKKYENRIVNFLENSRACLPLVFAMKNTHLKKQGNRPFFKEKT